MGPGSRSESSGRWPFAAGVVSVDSGVNWIKTVVVKLQYM